MSYREYERMDVERWKGFEDGKKKAFNDFQKIIKDEQRRKLIDVLNQFIPKKPQLNTNNLIDYRPKPIEIKLPKQEKSPWYKQGFQDGYNSGRI